MFVLVSYDVSTIDRMGKNRLHKVARTCQSYGQRVQNSVFECLVDPAQWANLRQKLLDTYEPKQDSLRFYFLGANWRNRVEHHGMKETLDLEGPLIL